MKAKGSNTRSIAPNDADYLQSFAIRNVSANISLEEQEAAANALVREALHQSKMYQADHNYKLPDHLEQFRLEYERASEKSKLSIPMVSQLSPRTKREASLLPKPTFFEEQKINKLVELSKKTDTNTLYNGLIPKQKADDLPRFSSIANSKMVLIPHNVPRDVNKKSTNYFETMENAVKRKKEQDEKLARLFDKYSDEPKVVAKSVNTSTTSHTHVQRKQSVLPKLAPMSSSATLAPSAVKAQPTASSVSAVSTAPRSAIGRAGSLNLSRSFSTLGMVPTGGPKPGSASYAPLSSIDPNHDEAVVSANTPLLHSMLQSNPLLGERGSVRYSTQDMASILQQRYAAENDRLQRITAKLDAKSETEYLNLFSVQVLEESGLDLNKEYNKIRNYTVYLMQLSYHFYIQRMRAGFAHFHGQYRKIREARMAKASQIIMRAVRLGVYLLTKTERRRRQHAQSDFESQRLREIEALRRAKCRIIYRAMFMFTKMREIRRLVRNRKAATKIQKRVRGMIGRRIAHEWKVMHAFLTRHAVKIQCAYRCRLARRKVSISQRLPYLLRCAYLFNNFFLHSYF